jgi:hypothetical protein
MQAIACMFTTHFNLLRRPTKKNAGYLSMVPADSTIAAHCRPRGKFGISAKKGSWKNLTPTVVPEKRVE